MASKDKCTQLDTLTQAEVECGARMLTYMTKLQEWSKRHNDQISVIQQLKRLLKEEENTDRDILAANTRYTIHAHIIQLQQHFNEVMS